MVRAAVALGRTGRTARTRLRPGGYAEASKPGNDKELPLPAALDLFNCQTASHAHVIAPVLCPARGSPSALVSFAFLCPMGACGTLGRSTAPAAPCAVFEKTHELHSPSDAVFRLRSARDGLCGLLHVPGGVATADACPVRVDCYPDMHLDRPPVLPVVTPGAAFRDLAVLTRQSGVRHRGGHRIPLRVSMTLATRPLPERNG